jgi:hypothetical protein
MADLLEINEAVWMVMIKFNREIQSVSIHI